MNVIQMAMNGEDISTVGKSIINDPRVDQFVDDSSEFTSHIALMNCSDEKASGFL